MRSSRRSSQSSACSRRSYSSKILSILNRSGVLGGSGLPLWVGAGCGWRKWFGPQVCQACWGMVGISDPMAQPWKWDVVGRLLVLLTVLVVVFAGSATVPRSADATAPSVNRIIVFASAMDSGLGAICARAFAGGSAVRLTDNTALPWVI